MAAVRTVNSISLIFLTVCNFRILCSPSLTLSDSLKAYLAISFSFLPLFLLPNYGNGGWLVGTPGQIICIPLSFCGTGAIPQRPRFVYEAFHIRVHYSDLLPQ